MSQRGTEVLACIDFSDASDAVAREGARVAHTAGNRLHLVHVAAGEPALAGYDKDPMGAHTRDERADELRTEHESLQTLATSLESDPAYEGLHVVPLVVMGATTEKILEEAERIDAGLIVVGSHGHGKLHHLLLGSVSHGIVEHSPRPVVVVPVRPR
jgi:nucleotide-binding universal stress UspA family protein